ncbi:MAG: hypothetical protein ACK5MU_01440 [Candidatus Saccharimonadales bacterium]
MKLSYLEDTSSYNDIHYAPVTLMKEPEADYNIGDIYETDDLLNAITGKDEGAMNQIVSDIVTLKDGSKIYILTYDTEEHVDDQGEHIYRDLIEAVRKIELY